MGGVGMGEQYESIKSIIFERSKNNVTNAVFSYCERIVNKNISTQGGS